MILQQRACYDEVMVNFNKCNFFAIVQLVHRLPRVLHHFCLQPQSYYTLLVYFEFVLAI